MYKEEPSPKNLTTPWSLLRRVSHLYNLDPHVIDGLLCVGGRLCNASLPSERKNQIILPKEWHVTKLIIYNHYSICGHWQRARPSLISREVSYPTRKFYCQRHSLKVCELLSLIGAPLSTENGWFTRDSRFAWQVTLNRSWGTLLWSLSCQTWA